jgi:hypothetical protein
MLHFALEVAQGRSRTAVSASSAQPGTAFRIWALQIHGFTAACLTLAREISSFEQTHRPARQSSRRPRKTPTCRAMKALTVRSTVSMPKLQNVRG